MKVLGISQIREADQFTILHEPVASIDLMERAAGQLFKWFRENTDPGASYVIICGPGNNGGDGLALARMLADVGWEVSVVLIWFSAQGSPDLLINLERLREQGKVPILEVRNAAEFPPLKRENLILVDGLLGSGLSRPVEGLAAEAIKAMNATVAPVIAIDVPSGLFCDAPTDAGKGAVVRAVHTLTFQSPKLSFFFSENEPFVGEWTVLPIGLHPDYLEEAKSHYHFITSTECRRFLKSRSRFGHKGSYGHALLIAGNPGKFGAAVLAARACLRSGPGLVSLSLPAEGIPVLQTSVPEAMVILRPDEHQFLLPRQLEPFRSIATGPGLGTSEALASALKQLIQITQVPLILDADALNILSQNKTWIAFLPKDSILTPHPGEFERLAGKSANSFERLSKQRDLSIRYGLYIILKGAHTCISAPSGDCWFNGTGNPGMATGGSGDVLTGILAGLMAQGYSSLETAMLGVWLHGYAGDLALEEGSWESLLPSDVIGHLGQAFSDLRG